MTAVLDFLSLFRQRWFAAIGLVVIIVIVIAALLAPIIAPYDPLEINALNRLIPPNAEYWFGTDHAGRDLFSRVIYGARMALLTGIGVVVIALVFGVILGTLSAYYPTLGLILMRVVDVLMGIPALLLALAFVVVLGKGLLNSMIAVGAIYVTTTARITYGLTRKIVAETYIEAVTSLGAGDLRILWRHVLPNLVSPLMVQATFIFAFAQLSTASLDFLGLGLPPDVPSWGNMVAETRRYITRAPWLLMFPGGAIILTVFSLNLVGDVLRDRLDPRFKDDLAKW
ncbi:MAG: ABC transporter permease [Alphaproteobacteria bacterium]|nr:ABC transporter permease [Alphaproteobacteria bacterium]